MAVCETVQAGSHIAAHRCDHAPAALQVLLRQPEPSPRDAPMMRAVFMADLLRVASIGISCSKHWRKDGSSGLLVKPDLP